MLDGAARLGDLFSAAGEMGMSSIAMTDHGYLFGAFDFWKQATGAGIKPIIGLEAYITPGTHRTDKSRVKWRTDESQKGDDVSGGGAYTHMTLLAKNNTGMHNLFKAASIASLDSVFSKWPRIDLELLEQYSEGIIATTGCPSGEVQVRLRLGQYEEAKAAAAKYREIFGAENYYLELMDHGLSIEKRVTNDLLRLGKELDLPLVATNDLHYTHESDAKAHEALLAIQSGSKLIEPTYDQGGSRFAFSGSGYYLKSGAEMRSLFAEIPEACDNTLEIAEKCEVSFNTDANYMPKFPCPPGHDETSWLIEEVANGLKYRYPDGVPPSARERADYELDIIIQMGFPGYFLVVADFINWSKDNGIRVGPGRGSGAGSMVAYAMRITDLDPIQHGLIFERFLNPERVSMPDFDVDFDDRRRGEVIDYVTEKYGADYCAQIVTFGTIKTKQALKDSARVLGKPFSLGERLTKALPPAEGAKDIPLANIEDPQAKRYNEAGEFRELLATETEARETFDTALGLEGLKRQWGVHAAGVIMSSEKIEDVIPIMRRFQDGQVITQFEYPICEDLGLIKMDFLGLRNLTIVSDALENIQQNRGETLDLERLPLEDEATYELLSRGDTIGVFQLDGGGLQSLLRLMKPDNFEDISATLALYRPGPMGAESHTNYALRKNGQQPVTPIHPELEEPLKDILDETYGLIIYQEQVMAIARKVAGYSLGQADILRRVMGKKKKAELDKQQVGFFEGMKERGYSESAAQALWDILLPFSEYAFNKAHSAAYGVVSFWTAYLKRHYPAEYMAALLTSVGQNRDKLAMYLNQCRHMGISVLPPDVNTSAQTFTPVGEDIRFGMGAVRNVGANVVAGIVEAREEKGDFTSFNDFLGKVPSQVCNKRTIESLIKAGAFDELGENRRSLVEVHEEAVDAVVGVKRQEAAGQFDLFAGLGGGEDDEPAFHIQIPDRPEWEKKEKLAFERDMLGLYVSDHPLNGLEGVIQNEAEASIASVIDPESPRPDGSQVKICGLITQVTRKVSKNSGKPYAIVAMEDFDAGIEVMFFGDVYEPVASLLQPDLVVTVTGRIRKSEDRGTSMMAQSMTIPDVTDPEDRPLNLTVPMERCTPELAEKLKSVLQANSGQADVILELTRPGKTTVMRLDRTLRVSPGPNLFGDLKGLLGPRCLVPSGGQNPFA
ncbi:DNA polymerase III subunit alpha [Brevibacterium litoralis]|uniref:DNA polymerase III subunit alpha n=1 Tax=Brevibacterium litoralis TaxID=3138935 RepID=UPI003D9A25EC